MSNYLGDCFFILKDVLPQCTLWNTMLHYFATIVKHSDLLVYIVAIFDSIFLLLPSYPAQCFEFDT